MSSPTFPYRQDNSEEPTLETTNVVLDDDEQYANPVQAEDEDDESD
jgi:hypothetical protein